VAVPNSLMLFSGLQRRSLTSVHHGKFKFEQVSFNPARFFVVLFLLGNKGIIGRLNERIREQEKNAFNGFMYSRIK